jgi:hypothetical protein
MHCKINNMASTDQQPKPYILVLANWTNIYFNFYLQCNIKISRLKKALSDWVIQQSDNQKRIKKTLRKTDNRWFTLKTNKKLFYARKKN